MKEARCKRLNIARLHLSNVWKGHIYRQKVHQWFTVCKGAKGNVIVIEISKADCSDVAQLYKCTKNHCIVGLQWSVMEIIP